ncbi:SCO family protein [Bermanella sp. R86510]|uniref:SCO family protein n=1 Tax=unclassified Bermanella TaxID=2627862 RepID=UPI0037C52266
MRHLVYLFLFVLVACSESMPESYQPLPQAIELDNFTLYNQDNENVGQAELLGKWSLVFFGYTYCPDVCPTTLAELNRVAKNVERDDFQVVMISVDPQRDTPEQLKSYIEYFNPKFKGWSGDIGQIEHLTRLMHIFFQKQPHGESYLMDHSSQVVLINPQGQYQGFFTAPLDEKAMSEYLRTL